MVNENIGMTVVSSRFLYGKLPFPPGNDKHCCLTSQLLIYDKQMGKRLMCCYNLILKLIFI